MTFSLPNNKGLILIGIIIVAVLFVSRDLECVLLMTGIVVNIIAICLNTGVTESKQSRPTEFLPVRSKKLLDKYHRKQLIHYEKDEDESESEGEREDEYESEDDRPVVAGGKESFEQPEKPYKGAVDFQDCTGTMYQTTGADNTAFISIKHQGANARRQISGANKRYRVLNPYIAQELEDEGNLPWYGAYDL